MKADPVNARVPYTVLKVLALSLASTVPFSIKKKKKNSGSFMGKPSAKQGTFREHGITMLTVAATFLVP